MKVSGYHANSPGKASRFHVLCDLPHRGKAGIPRGTRMVLSESPDEILEQHVGHATQMRGGDAAVAMCGARAIENDDTEPRAFEEICGSDSGDTSTDDHDIRVKVPVERWKFRQGSRREPIACSHAKWKLQAECHDVDQPA